MKELTEATESGTVFFFLNLTSYLVFFVPHGYLETFTLIEEKPFLSWVALSKSFYLIDLGFLI